MAQDEPFAVKAFLGLGASGLLLLGVALLLAILKSAPVLLAWWVVLVFQIVLTVVLVAVGTSFCAWLVSEAIGGFVGRIARIERDHEDLLRRIKRRTPACLATAILTAQAALLLADKSFDGQPVPTLAVSVCLLVSFWISNEFQASERRVLVVLGWLMWFLSLLYLPAAVMLFHGWGLSEFAKYVWRFDAGTKAFLGSAIMALVAAPLLAAAWDDGKLGRA